MVRRYTERVGLFGFGLMLGAIALLWTLRSYEDAVTLKCAAKGKVAVIVVSSSRWQCIGERK